MIDARRIVEGGGEFNTCSRCGNRAIANAFCRAHYYAEKNAREGNGRVLKTPEERAATQKAATLRWQSENKQHMHAYRKAYRAMPHAMELARQRAARSAAKNRERERQRAAKWREDNPEKDKAMRALYYQNNKEKIRDASAARNITHREACRHYSRESKARRRAPDGEKMPRGYREGMLLDQGGACNACRCDLTVAGYQVDHIVAVARGGLHVQSNLQLLCPTCNRQKHTKDFNEFLRMKGLAREEF